MVLCGLSALEILLVSIEEVLTEEKTASDRLSLGVADAIVMDSRADLLHHLPTQTRVHLTTCSLVRRFFEDETNDLNERSVILLMLTLLRPSDDLVRNGFELLHRELVEQRASEPYGQ